MIQVLFFQRKNLFYGSVQEYMFVLVNSDNTKSINNGEEIPNCHILHQNEGLKFTVFPRVWKRGFDNFQRTI